MQRRTTSALLVLLLITPFSLLFLPALLTADKSTTQGCVEIFTKLDRTAGIRVSPTFEVSLDSNLTDLLKTVGRSLRVSDQVSYNGIPLHAIKQCLNVLRVHFSSLVTQ